MRYFRPKSFTWWVGVLAIALGVLLTTGLPPHLVAENGLVLVLAKVLAALGGGGDSSPAGLIFLGAGMIGIRDKLEREAQQAELRHYDSMVLSTASFKTLDQIEDDFEDDLPNEPGYNPNENLPAGESPFPEGVNDPYGPGGSR